MTAVDHRDPCPRPWAPGTSQPQDEYATGCHLPSAGVSLEELRRAWAAVKAGDFRPERGHPEPVHAAPAEDSTTALATPTWAAAGGEQVLPVLGCTGSCGASTLAVAIASVSTGTTPDGRRPRDGATAAGRRPAFDAARVVECVPPAASGLVAASTSELGAHPTGWLRGTRGEVLLERVGGYVTGPGAVPAPCPPPQRDAGDRLTVLDLGWDLDRVLHEPSWVREQLVAAEHVVLATTATVPGLRRLEVSIDVLGDVSAATVHAAVLGPPRRRWPRPLAHSLGPRTRDLDSNGRLTLVPHDRALAVAGLGPAPLPAPLLSAAGRLLTRRPAAARGATP